MAELTLRLKDMEPFKNLVELIKKLIDDERIDESVRKEYEEKIIEIAEIAEGAD